LIFKAKNKWRLGVSICICIALASAPSIARACEGPITEEPKGGEINFGKRAIKSDTVAEQEILFDQEATVTKEVIKPVNGNAFTLLLPDCKELLFGVGGKCIAEVLFEPSAAGKYESLLEFEIKADKSAQTEAFNISLVGEA
jgi:hypothetical protein